MEWINNPHRGTAALDGAEFSADMVVDDASAAQSLMAMCPVGEATPLRNMGQIASKSGVAKVVLKDETTRMGLGSFKALGAAHAIAKMAAAKGSDDWATALKGETFVCASAGNHGLSVAAGARVFGADAVVYLAETVPAGFADRLRNKGARVEISGADYEESLAAAHAAAETNGWFLLSDSTWPGYSQPALDVMEGYLIMAAEITGELEAPPTHIFLQAGVGGLAAALTAHFRREWGAAPFIAIVEPEFAPALYESIKAGRAVTTTGPESAMGRLDCKEPSYAALARLGRDADAFVLISEAEAQEAVNLLAAAGIETTPSGVAGFAGFMHWSAREDAPFDKDSRVLAIISEGPA